MGRLICVLAFGIIGLSLIGARAAQNVEALAAEYRTLRLQRGHFSGGEWNDAVDRNGGRKQQVMAELGTALGDGTHRRAEIVRLMGPPDEILTRRERMFRESYKGNDRRVRELLVYHWRGRHDFLYFASDGARVLVSGWWAALE